MLPFQPEMCVRTETFRVSPPELGQPVLFTVRMLRNTNSLVARVVCSASIAKILAPSYVPNVPTPPPLPRSLTQGQSCSLMKVIFSAGIKNVVVAPSDGGSTCGGRYTSHFILMGKLNVFRIALQGPLE